MSASSHYSGDEEQDGLLDLWRRYEIETALQEAVKLLRYVESEVYESQQHVRFFARLRTFLNENKEAS